MSLAYSPWGKAVFSIFQTRHLVVYSAIGTSIVIKAADILPDVSEKILIGSSLLLGLEIYFYNLAKESFT